MVNFKKIVEVVPDDPKCTLQKLALELGETKEYFVNVPEDWIRQQKFITAYPYALSLGKWSSPESMPKYVIAGLSENEVKTLEEDFGYEVHECVETHQKVQETPKEKVPVKNTEKGVEQKKESYSVNGKSVSREEFENKLVEFEKFLSDMSESVSNFFNI